MRKIRTRWWKGVATGTAALMLLGSGLSGSAASVDKRSGGFGKVVDLIRLARATAPFHDVQKAIDAGWVVEPMCMDYPDGFHGEPPGTMGHHFYNLEYLTDGGRIDPAEPELVLYEKRADGSWRLNAVEFIIPAADLPPTAPAPELFGQKFRFYPEIGSNGIWGLHVWLWRHNPYGMYANLNPNVSCEYADAGAS